MKKNTFIFTFIFTIGCIGPEQKTTSKSFVTVSQTNKGSVMNTAKNLHKSKGKIIEIQGLALASKVGAFLQLEDGYKLWCTGKNSDWGKFIGKKVHVIGRITEGSTPLENFPIARQDKNGNWSQGVGDSRIILDPTGLPNMLKPEELPKDIEELNKDKSTTINQGITPSPFDSNTTGKKSSSLLLEIQEVSLNE
jgi:hypothetical protein